MQSEFTEALKTLQDEFTRILTDALTPVKEDEEEAPVEEEQAAEKSEEAAEEVEEEVDAPEETTEEEEEEPVAEKGESKAEPIHDNIAEKHKKFNIYEFMGRNANGTRKH